jgi:DNA segregation ATPase FtsK/SpoIIIE-like protein
MFKKKPPLINNPLNLNNSRQTRFILIGLFFILMGIIAIIDYRGMLGNFLVFPTLYLFGVFHFLWALTLIIYGAYLAIFRQNLKVKINLNFIALIAILIILMIGFSDYKTSLTNFFSFYNNSFFSNRLLTAANLLTSSIGGGFVGFILYSTMVTLVGVDVTQIIYLLTFIAMVFIILRPFVYRLGSKMITYRQEREQKVKIRQEARKRGFNKFYGDSKNNVFLDEREALESLAVNVSNEPEVTTLDDDSFIRRDSNQPVGAAPVPMGNFNIFKDNVATERSQSVGTSPSSTSKPKSNGGGFNIFKDPVIEGGNPTPISPSTSFSGSGSSYFQTPPTRGTQGGIFASEPTPLTITPTIEPEVEELETSSFVDEINKPQNNEQDLPFANDQEINEYFEKEKPIVKVRRGKYIFPSLELLESSEIDDLTKKREDAGINAVKINTKLEILGIRGKVKDFIIAPAFTRFLVEVESDVKMAVFNTITNDIMAAVSSSKINILAPIPNSPYVGIDIPNSKRSKVTLKELFVNIPFNQPSSLLTVPLGKDINGATVSVEINKTPHMLIAGTTGSGKSVCMNSIIMSLLLKTSPDDVRIMIVDPKRVEMSAFNDLPHLLCPIITDAKKAAVALNKLVGVMESRYQMFQETGNKNIESYNRYAIDNNKEKIPYYIVIIDELADLILVSSKEVEEAIRRITQLARAAGIHLVVATQRPSVDVITGVIKANIPTRIAFAVSSYVDSKTILDAVGAEDLLGLGDMLLSLSGSGGIQRVQGSYVSDDEIYKVVSHVKKQREPNFDPEFLNLEPPVPEQLSFSEEFADDTQEDLYFQILNFLSTQKVVSISSLQRKFNLGFPRAGSFIDRLEREGLVSVNKGSKPRDVYQDLIQTRLNQG